MDDHSRRSATALPQPRRGASDPDICQLPTLRCAIGVWSAARIISWPLGQEPE